MDSFRSLTDNINGFARYVAASEPAFQEQVLSFFPNSPYKIDREAWVRFEEWLLTRSGQRVIDFCLSWGCYGRYVFRVCPACVDLVSLPVAIEVISDVAEDYVGVEVGLEVDEADLGEEDTVEDEDIIGSAFEDDEEIPGMLEIINILINWIEGHVFRAVERSLCNEHFVGFQAFHHDLVDFSHLLALSTNTAIDHALTFFPPHPKKVGRTNWIQLENWMSYGLGAPFKGICQGWCRYGHFQILHCLACRACSRTPAPEGDAGPLFPDWNFGELANAVVLADAEDHGAADGPNVVPAE
ncbi:hypothetical protein FRX31_020354 [Thalictrum thalictroides]|uniref:Uncharacterized protein n=1 Tax=Thalictrum thalictroides TaxID=46969 RepID=A0A7J6VY50_THATH|nr:hypothetical protein FRX31_020354 [Thalictrum thalictroides]